MSSVWEVTFEGKCTSRLEMNTEPSTVMSIIMIFLNFGIAVLENAGPTMRVRTAALFNRPALAQLCPKRLEKKSLRLDTWTSRSADPVASSEFTNITENDKRVCAGIFWVEVTTRPGGSSIHFAAGSNQIRLRPKTVPSPFDSLSLRGST